MFVGSLLTWANIPRHDIDAIEVPHKIATAISAAVVIQDEMIRADKAMIGDPFA